MKSSKLITNEHSIPWAIVYIRDLLIMTAMHTADCQVLNF